MAGWDIVLVNPGGGFDIDFAGAPPPSSMVGNFVSAVDFTGTMSDGPIEARVASAKIEFVTNLSDAASVASAKVEVVTGLNDFPRVASAKVEVVTALTEPVDVASAKIEVCATRPFDPYTPARTGGGSSGGICTSFEEPQRGFGDATGCCSGFNEPNCDSTSTPGTEVLLAFYKASDDDVLLCVRGAFSPLFPTGGLSLLTWIRVTEYNGGVAGAVPIFDGIENSAGWLLSALGTASPADVAISYRDTGAVLRDDTYTFAGGDLRAAGWQSCGGFRSGTNPWPQRAFVSTGVGGSTDGTVAPASGSDTVITLFGSPGGAYFTGRLLCPIMIASDLGSDGDDTWQLNYYNDLGRRQSSIYSQGNLLMSPRAHSSVQPNDPVRVWAVDSQNGEVADAVVWGTPSYWKGPWWGLNFEDIHWIQVPVDDDLTTGKTVFLRVQGASAPGADQFIAGRMDGGLGGFEVAITSANGITAVARLYDAAGGLVLTLTTNVSAGLLGEDTYYVLSIGAGGTGNCFLRCYADSTLVGSSNGTPSAPMVANQDHRWGRSHSGSPYLAGTCFRWAEADSQMSEGQITAVIAGGSTGIVMDIWGVSGNVVDDAAPERLWGPYDATGTYGSQIIFESIGSSEVVVGS